MIGLKRYNQHGAVLIITLVMLLALTMLAVSSMRGVSLETQMTATLIGRHHLKNSVSAALREGEFRLYGSDNLRDKLEANIERNCVKNNTVKMYGKSRPCLLIAMTDEQLFKYFLAPVRFFKENNSYTEKYDNKNISDIQSASLNSTVAWMPYRGLDSNSAHYYTPDGNGAQAYWNSYRINSRTVGSGSINPEYGSELEGSGVFFYLITAQAEDVVAAQSTVAVIYLGVNN